MLVIFEGTDGSGKSTLLKELLYLEDGYIRAELPNRFDNNVVEQWSNIRDLSKNDIVLVDRSCIMELIYGTVCGDHVFNMTLAEILESFDTDNTVFVYCKHDEAFDANIRRGEDYIKDRVTHDKLEECYKRLMELLSHKYTVLEYCWSTQHVFQINEKLQQLNKR